MVLLADRPSSAPVPPWQVLLVEDDDHDFRRIADSLQAGDLAHRSSAGECSDGKTDQPIAAANGNRRRFTLHRAQALEPSLKRLAAGGFDLVLLDMTLPDCGGLESVRRTKAAARDVPIVVLTRSEEEPLARTALRLGAQDYLPKPHIDHDSLHRSMRYAIETADRAKIARKLRHANEEFDAVRAVQQQFFPKRAPQVAGFELAGQCYPADAAGGDYYDFFPMYGGTWGIALGDVSGHGIAAAMVMSQTRAIIRALATVYGDVGLILTRAQRLLADDLPPHAFITLFLARLDPRTGVITYASAGHDGFLLRADGSLGRHLEATAPPINVTPEAEVPPAPKLVLKPREMLLLMTDGVTESRAPDVELFDPRRALEIVRLYSREQPDEIIRSLYHSARAFAHYAPQQDDATAVVVRRGA